ncbi:AAA family ATPase [Paenibacillus hexagrammi]|uniref:Uncharacterized protein n=1 Tax=Paenibacillus hexagrammi TaxID=2908839 RepID=A0ABY3SC11_9BACL|nr:hypothetical protein [Paenibacillus sp. YPD9-1]UJF31533.1 hypothetical protein L0M14_17145 [Paenibacillus sp. YPD9-1]
MKRQQKAAELGGLQLQMRREQELIQALEIELKKKGIPLVSADYGLENDEMAVLQHLAKDYSRWRMLMKDAEHQQEREADRLQHLRMAEELSVQGKVKLRQMLLRLSFAAAVMAVLLPLWLILEGDIAAGAIAFLLLAGGSVYLWIASRPEAKKRSSRSLALSSVESRGGPGSELGRLNDQLTDLEARLREQIEKQLSGQADSSRLSRHSGLPESELSEQPGQSRLSGQADSSRLSRHSGLHESELPEQPGHTGSSLTNSRLSKLSVQEAAAAAEGASPLIGIVDAARSGSATSRYTGNGTRSTDTSTSSSRGTSTSPFSAFLREFEPQLDAWIREAEQKQRLSGELKLKAEKLADSRHEWHILAKQEEQLLHDLREYDLMTDAVQDQWKQWLRGRDLHEELSPEAALETVQAVEQGHELLRQLRKAEGKREQLGKLIQQFEDDVMSCLQVQPQQKRDFPLLLKRWKEEEREQRKLLSHKEQFLLLLSESSEQYKVLERQLELVQARIDALLQEASSESGEQLRSLQRKVERYAALLQEQAAAEEFLESLAGGSHVTELTGILESQGEEELETSRQQLETRAALLHEECNTLRESLGQLAAEISALEQGTAQADRRLQAETVRSSMGRLVDQYAAASFASLLIKKARDVYERERQPDVLLRAGAYFAIMTDGKYRWIKAPFGEQRLVAVRESGQAVDTSQLSRGTAEQLYLSMRFALAEEYAGRVVLPLVMDDILVNFDEKRMESCLKVIEELSRRHQILLFTCHSHVRDAAAKLIATCQLIDL